MSVIMQFIFFISTGPKEYSTCMLIYNTRQKTGMPLFRITSPINMSWWRQWNYRDVCTPLLHDFTGSMPGRTKTLAFSSKGNTCWSSMGVLNTALPEARRNEPGLWLQILVQPDDAHEKNHTVLESTDSTFCTLASKPISLSNKVWGDRVQLNIHVCSICTCPWPLRHVPVLKRAFRLLSCRKCHTVLKNYLWQYISGIL